MLSPIPQTNKESPVCDLVENGSTDSKIKDLCPSVSENFD